MTLCTTKFIVDTYDKYSSVDRAVARYIFNFHDQVWAVKEYNYEDGHLARPLRFYEREDENDWFYLYDTLDDAMRYVYQIRGQLGSNE